ncbi:MAG: hypothetical protein IPK83_19585 [Planctomycetes bacterium]|nr:hypothetical protein [Planctomycetota bacterium]
MIVTKRHTDVVMPLVVEQGLEPLKVLFCHGPRNRVDCVTNGWAANQRLDGMILGGVPFGRVFSPRLIARPLFDRRPRLIVEILKDFFGDFLLVSLTLPHFCDVDKLNDVVATQARMRLDFRLQR